MPKDDASSAILVSALGSYQLRNGGEAMEFRLDFLEGFILAWLTKSGRLLAQKLSERP